MPVPATKSTWRLVAPILLAAGAGAAQPAPPTDAAQADAAAQALVDGAQSAESAAPAEGAAPQDASAAVPGASIIARWMRSSACRMFIDFPIDETTRFSPDQRTRARLDWRMSLPSYADARLSLTRGSAGAEEAPAGDPAGAAPAATVAADGQVPAPGESAPSAPVLAGAAPAGAADTGTVAAGVVQGAPPTLPPQLTWTQKVGLVKAASAGAAGPSSASPAAPAPEPTWTQKVGLVKAPSGGSGSAANTVSSFKKTVKAESD
ncbi:MAG TPA: hypothetical protein VFF69_00045 [Phycisphaerales bacterium]|nr:hypothetical protein [Phycisphaerales bacterium]